MRESIAVSKTVPGKHLREIADRKRSGEQNQIRSAIREFEEKSSCKMQREQRRKNWKILARARKGVPYENIWKTQVLLYMYFMLYFMGIITILSTEWKS